jgi:hypothetical protein
MQKSGACKDDRHIHFIDDQRCARRAIGCIHVLHRFIRIVYVQDTFVVMVQFAGQVRRSVGLVIDPNDHGKCHRLTSRSETAAEHQKDKEKSDGPTQHGTRSVVASNSPAKTFRSAAKHNTHCMPGHFKRAARLP